MFLAVPKGTADGGVAQLGERSVRIREVEGSNPFVSTIKETSFVYQKDKRGFLFSSVAYGIITSKKRRLQNG